MQLTLKKEWTEHLVNLPESGMGYQRVSIRLKDGTVVADALVFNAEVLEVPDEIPPFKADDIVDVQIVTAPKRRGKTRAVKKKVRKAVFPAAGLGTRFLPATKAQPKEMLPLVDKPIIQYAVEEALASGIENIIIVTGRGKNAIEDHFDVSYELEKILEERGKHELLAIVRDISDLIHVSYVRQKAALGLGHAILMARELVGEEPFAVLLGDDVIDAPVPCLGQMLEAFYSLPRPGSVVAIQKVRREAVSSYGIISGQPLARRGNSSRLYRLTGLVEKPSVKTAPSDLAIIGRYILEPEIFELLAKTRTGARGEIQLTDALQKALLEQRAVYGFRFEGVRYDAGDKLGFLQATVQYALKHPDRSLQKAFRQYLKTLRLD